MAAKVKKGLLKPLRYLSHVFDGKERELQIGYPTDVEHVAHVGWDGPDVNAPSWMREFHSAPLSSTPFGEEGREKPIGNLWASREINSHGLLESPPIQETARPRRSRRHKSDAIIARDRQHRRRSKGSGESPYDGQD